MIFCSYLKDTIKEIHEESFPDKRLLLREDKNKPLRFKEGKNCFYSSNCHHTDDFKDITFDYCVMFFTPRLAHELLAIGPMLLSKNVIMIGDEKLVDKRYDNPESTPLMATFYKSLK